MATSRSKRNREVLDETKIKYAIDFIEELSWLLDSKKKLNLSEIPKVLRDSLFSTKDEIGAADKYVSPNPNIHYLIGVLPRLFQDEMLFSRNEEIAEFACEVLGITISRVEKRSKYELIGLIVCEANALDDEKLASLVSSLSGITGSSEKMRLMVREKKSTGFSWNETIRKLAVN